MTDCTLHKLGVISALIMLVLCQRAAMAQPSISTESANIHLFGVSTEVSSAYALVVAQGTVAAGYYLDDAVPIGTIGTGTSNIGFSFDVSGTETPVGVILAGVNGTKLVPTRVTTNFNFIQGQGVTFGVSQIVANAVFVGDPFFNLMDEYGSAETEPFMVNGITNIGAPFFGTDVFFSHLIGEPVVGNAFIPFNGTTQGELVNFNGAFENAVVANGTPSFGVANGGFTASFAVPAPQAVWPALLGFAALAAWKFSRRRLSA